MSHDEPRLRNTSNFLDERLTLTAHAINLLTESMLNADINPFITIEKTEIKCSMAARYLA
jgi:hypothetical protein